MLLRIDQLASHVAAHSGVSMPLADYALRAVVAGIGSYLSAPTRQLIADELPQPLAIALESAVDDRRPIEERVQLTGLTASQTHELVASVCKVLAEELSTEANQLLINVLPPGVAALLVPSAPAIDHVSTIHRQGFSVAEPNPHGEIKLSSGHRRGVDDKPS